MTLVNTLVALVQVVQTVLIAALTVCFALIAFFIAILWASWRKR